MFSLNPCSKLLLSLLFLISVAQAQQPMLYKYQDLSKTYYKNQSDSIQKAWKCPSVFDDRETQKKYKEIWDGRTKFITGSLEDNDYVYEKEIAAYIDGIIDQLMKANPAHFKSKPMLLLDRSSSVNAYAIGNGIIAVNMGLVNFCQTREELSLVIAHELSHNILSHAENSMKDRAELLASDAYKDSLNAILKSKYERLTRLNKVLKNFTFNRRKHQRYHEGDADSLAIQLMKKANIAFDSRFFLRLDSADMEYHTPLKLELGKYFAAYDITIDDAWTKKRTKGLSTRNYNFKDSTNNDDSLKTHPECKERYERNKLLTDAGRTLTPVPAAIRERANRIIVWNLYRNDVITGSLYRILLEKDKGNNNNWYDLMFANAITSLYYADRELHRFGTIGMVKKENVSSEYYQLQTMLEQIPREQLETIAKKLGSASFWSKAQPDEKSLKSFLSTLTFDADVSRQNRSKAAEEFIKAFPTSPYIEFASPFEKK
ncbi:M48 family metalloprotease [Pseudoflavitalea sp. G-6-1-2]|uniref:M48 family metalloprotease n=1 Tax=Pseudoflavitalea sp. G-6-1-2 TaxID=2728841 RepID=UPI00146BA4F2|nr:M48 family metalloprotease [Pseudoflavitalea sp. G-6-1-2]NML23728.1 M48 family metalloprotease [Pseudoflavitalea sp. G-6-1-2]